MTKGKVVLVVDIKIKEEIKVAGKMAYQFRAFTALSEDQNCIPTWGSSQRPVIPVPEELMPSVGTCTDTHGVTHANILKNKTCLKSNQNKFTHRIIQCLGLGRWLSKMFDTQALQPEFI